MENNESKPKCVTEMSEAEISASIDRGRKFAMDVHEFRRSKGITPFEFCIALEACQLASGLTYKRSSMAAKLVMARAMPSIIEALDNLRKPDGEPKTT